MERQTPETVSALEYQKTFRICESPCPGELSDWLEGKLGWVGREAEAAVARTPHDQCEEKGDHVYCNEQVPGEDRPGRRF